MITYDEAIWFIKVSMITFCLGICIGLLVKFRERK
jgi:hypothetical protein